jgi:hypothetical protein
LDEPLLQRREEIFREIEGLERELSNELNAGLARAIETRLADAEARLMLLEIEAAGW